MSNTVDEGNPVNRNVLLDRLANYYETRAVVLNELRRRYGNMVTAESEAWKAQEAAFKEAAAYAYSLKDKIGG